MSVITANDPNILYSPYTWLVTEAYAKTINAGAYLRIAFTGTPTTLTANFDMTGVVSPRLAIRYDGGPWQDAAISASMTVNLAQSTDPTVVNMWSTHLVEIMFVASSEGVNRWTNQVNAVKFTSITADVDIVTVPVRPKPLYGFVLGDSIAEGVRTLAISETGNQKANDNRFAWTGPLKDAVGAELGTAGFGAVGIVGSGSGSVPPFAQNVPYLWSGQPRDLSSPQAPDFIVAHIGTNDGSKADTDVTNGTRDLLNYLIASTPSKTAILVLAGWLQRKAAAIRSGIAVCSDPSRIQFVDTTGWWDPADSSDNLHPYGYANVTNLVPRLAAAVNAAVLAKQTTGTSSTLYLDAAGQWKPALNG